MLDQAAHVRWARAAASRWARAAASRWVPVAGSRWVPAVVSRWARAAAFRWVPVEDFRWVPVEDFQTVLILGVASLPQATSARRRIPEQRSCRSCRRGRTDLQLASFGPFLKNFCSSCRRRPVSIADLDPDLRRDGMTGRHREPLGCELLAFKPATKPIRSAGRSCKAERFRVLLALSWSCGFRRCPGRRSFLRCRRPRGRRAN